MRSGSIAEAALRLPWLPPGIPTLLALTDPALPVAWGQVRHDPGLVLHLVRSSFARVFTPGVSAYPTLLQAPEILDTLCQHLQHGEPATWKDTGDAKLLVHRNALRYACTAEYLASRTGQCDPDNAWVAGLLAPLGWLAVVAFAPDRVHACVNDPAWNRDPEAVQKRIWGLDHAALTRRLVRRWSLPEWLASLLGALALPRHVAQHLGADPGLFRVVQQALRLVQSTGEGLALAVPPLADDDAFPTLSMPSLPEDLPAEEAAPHVPAIPVEIVCRLLTLAAAQRRLACGAGQAQLEAELDVLYHLLRLPQKTAEDQLRDLKLRSLAEFAAGAGHEINNPLAVISGQAQYLLSHETEGERRKPLETIIAQTQRIHRLLREVMQFARPAIPQKQPVKLWRLLEEVMETLAPLAQQREVELRLEKRISGTSNDATLAGDPPGVLVHADAGQLRTVLTCVLRNAIEAAPRQGWACLALIPPVHDRVEVVVEDNGPGLTTCQREHLFDPFYSGRSAGRGAGLGLSIAWSLTRLQGGEVFLASQPEEITRFVVRLPLLRSSSEALAG